MVATKTRHVKDDEANFACGYRDARGVSEPMFTYQAYSEVSNGRGITRVPASTYSES
jgi:hypothetical protein